ncbi:MAG TPA: PQQ-binding-like beta-propeller repeat protein, partial [Rickettsiales bacterium]|nr:PQQ-binding-like beta-propeller repeat protein [Rickettsiales bacterium]
MITILKKIAIIFLLMSFISCSDDDAYDKKKAISVFADINEIKIDADLAALPIKLSNPIKNENWGVGFFQENEIFENLEFTPIQADKASKQKFLTKSRQIWSGYRPGFSDRFVFEPIIKNDKVFLLDASGILWAYDLVSKNRIFKNRIFKRRYLKNYQNPKIGYFDGTIYAIAGSNEIAAASAIDGKILWSKTILSLPISKPVSDGRMVYVITADSKTYALNAATGDLIWVVSGVDKSTAILGAANPVIYKDKLVVAYSSGEIYALNKSNGEEIFSQDLNINKAINSDFYLNDIDATPLVKDDVIYAIGNGGLMMAIDIKSGNYLWKKEIASIADFWAASGFLFVVDNNDRLITLSQKTGNVKAILQLPEFRDVKKPQTKIIYNGVIMAG